MAGFISSFVVIAVVSSRPKIISDLQKSVILCIASQLLHLASLGKTRSSSSTFEKTINLIAEPTLINLHNSPLSWRVMSMVYAVSVMPKDNFKKYFGVE